MFLSHFARSQIWDDDFRYLSSHSLTTAQISAITSRFSVDQLGTVARIGLSLGRARGMFEPAYALHRRQAYLSFSFFQTPH